MAKIPFLGPTYPSRSVNIAADRSINFFPELSQDDSKDIIALIGTPGSNLIYQVGSSPVRGAHVFNSLMFIVAGSSLYSIDSVGTLSASLGTLNTSSGRVMMIDNGLAVSGVGGDQLMIVDGGAGYIYNVTTGTFSTIAGGGWPTAGANSVTYLDGYFIITSAGSMSAHASNLFDGTTWNSLATSPISSSPDLLKVATSIYQQLWLIKEYSTEVWYDAGVATTTGFPFARLGGTVFDYGTTAPDSVLRMGGSLFWIATHRNNNIAEFAGIMQMSGYAPVIISPPAINYQISTFSRITDAFSFGYSMGGHTFAVFTFPSGNATFVYDLTTQMWHEWSSYVSPYAVGRHLSNCYAYFNGHHYVGDYASGNIYELDSNTYTDNEDPITSVRIAQHLFDKTNLSTGMIHRLQVDIESGIGLSTGASGAVDPQASLSWSDDGGHTYSSAYRASMGKIGEYSKRLLWKKLGWSRDRVFKLEMADPVKKVIIGGNVKATF